MNKYKSLKALTLIELLVVMAIVGVVLVLGVWGMFAFQRIILLQQAASELEAVMKETRSKAENNVFPAPYKATAKADIVYGYKINFQNGSPDPSDDLTRSLCERNTGGGAPWDCNITGVTERLKSNIFKDIEYVDAPGTNQDRCTSIHFENLTGDIWIYRQSFGASAYPVTTGNCSVLIKHKNSNSGGVVLYVDGDTNSFKMKNQ